MKIGLIGWGSLIGALWRKSCPDQPRPRSQPARPYVEPCLAQPGESVRQVLSSGTTQTTMEEEGIQQPCDTRIKASAIVVNRSSVPLITLGNKSAREATMKKSTTTATRKVNVTICVQLSENGQRNEIKKGRSGKPKVLVKGRISPEDVDLFKVDADGRLFTEQRHDSVLTVDELVQAARARARSADETRRISFEEEEPSG